MAFSGGFRYKPTTSSNFSTNCLSLESLKVRQMRLQAMSPPDSPCSLTPVALAIKDRLQCVAFGGFPSTVFFTIRARFRRPIEGIRPLREPSRPRSYQYVSCRAFIAAPFTIQKD